VTFQETRTVFSDFDLSHRESVNNMKKPKTEKMDELQPEYDLAPLLKEGVRGKYAAQALEGTTLVLLDPDVAAAFPTAASVNEALRLVMKLSSLPLSSSPKHGASAGKTE
jgi:hypothetical protein